MKILLVATRRVDGPQTGRKRVLRTIVRSCEALGHDVDVAVIGPAGPDPRCVSIPGPGPIEIGVNLVWHFLLGRKSLNECLYWSRSAQRRIARLAVDGQYDLVVADMVRTAQYCARLRLPWVLDLDDLLSDRYARLAEKHDGGQSVLGYFSHRLPVSMRRAAAAVTHRLLRVEAHRIASQEVHFGQRADAITLVSSVEAHALSEQLGRPVHDTAVGIDTPTAAAGDHAVHQKHAVAFTGGLDYQPNLDAVKHYLDRIAPELERAGCAIELHIVGNAPMALRPDDPFGRTVYLGYVDDLVSAIGRYSIFVAPIIASGGIKTKVLEAMANGLAVVATEQAVAGLGITSNKECVVARTPSEFATAIQRLADDPGACARIGHAARRFVSRNYSPAVMQEKWRVLLDEAVAHHRVHQSAAVA